MRTIFRLFFVSQIFIFSALIARLAPSSSEDQHAYIPWFTGPLLAPTPVNMKPTHPAIEPSLTIFSTYGSYDSHWRLEKQDITWAINPLIDFQFGITDYIGVETLVSFISNFKNGQTFSHFQDTTVLLGYQVSTDKKDSWVPDFRVLLQETFPTGKYQRLNPHKEGIDSTGMGSFQTGPVFAVRKLFHFPSNFFSLRCSIGYLFPSSLEVNGFNTYGGGHGTKGRVRPGHTLIAFISGEYSFNQTLVFAFDTEFLYQGKSHFSGRPGRSLSGQIATTSFPSSFQISFAPEIEYNFSRSSGLLAGLWFTLIGKNADAFASAFLAYVQVF